MLDFEEKLTDCIQTIGSLVNVNLVPPPMDNYKLRPLDLSRKIQLFLQGSRRALRRRKDQHGHRNPRQIRPRVEGGEKSSIARKALA